MREWLKVKLIDKIWNIIVLYYKKVKSDKTLNIKGRLLFMEIKVECLLENVALWYLKNQLILHQVLITPISQLGKMVRLS